jgi:hypothetical protein
MKKIKNNSGNRGASINFSWKFVKKFAIVYQYLITLINYFKNPGVSHE